MEVFCNAKIKHPIPKIVPPTMDDSLGPTLSRKAPIGKAATWCKRPLVARMLLVTAMHGDELYDLEGEVVPLTTYIGCTARYGEQDVELRILAFTWCSFLHTVFAVHARVYKNRFESSKT